MTQNILETINSIVNVNLQEDVFRFKDLSPEDKENIFKAFEKSYTDATGKSWTQDKFNKKARAWTFYGNKKGFVTIRSQKSGLAKLTGVAGSPKEAYKGFKELLENENEVWGMVDDKLAKMAAKNGMIVPHVIANINAITLSIYKMALTALLATIPSSVFDNVKYEISDDGGVIFKYPDVGDAKKYLIGTPKYFENILKNPDIHNKIKDVPELNEFLTGLVKKK